MFLYKDKIYNNILQILFPSPVGVLHVSIKKMVTYLKPEFEFPSPVGVLHVSMPKRYRKRLKALFPSPVGVLHVSIRLTTYHGISQSVFPSPVGVLHVSIKSDNWITNKEACFRPLSGSYMFL